MVEADLARFFSHWAIFGLYINRNTSESVQRLQASEDRGGVADARFITIGSDRDFLIGFSRSWLDTEIATDLWLVYVIPLKFIKNDEKPGYNPVLDT